MIDTNTSDYIMVTILMQGRRLTYYYFENFTRVILNYLTYDKELYALVQAMKKWKHYLMGKETIIHTDYQPLSYF